MKNLNLQRLDNVFGIFELVAEEEVDGQLGLFDGLRHGDGRVVADGIVAGGGRAPLLGLFPLQLALFLAVLAFVAHRREPLRDGILQLPAAAGIARADADAALLLLSLFVLLDRILEGVFENLSGKECVNYRRIMIGSAMLCLRSRSGSFVALLQNIPGYKRSSNKLAVSTRTPQICWT